MLKFGLKNTVASLYTLRIFAFHLKNVAFEDVVIGFESMIHNAYNKI